MVAILLCYFHVVMFKDVVAISDDYVPCHTGWFPFLWPEHNFETILLSWCISQISGACH